MFQGAGTIGANAAMVVAEGGPELILKFGVHTTVDADDDIVTGLGTILGAGAVLQSDPVAGMVMATVVVPATGGTLRIKGWESDFTAATTFSKVVQWWAIGKP
jgi:hypothetical protein